MNLSTKLAIAMVALASATAAAVGFLTNYNLERSIFPRALDRIELDLRLATRELEIQAGGISADIASFSAAASLHGIVRARIAGGTDPTDGITEAVWRERMASRFVAELTSKPAYLQFRVIGVQNNALEILRVARTATGEPPRILPVAEMRPAGDRSYFRETLKLKAGEVYISPIELVQENGKPRLPYVPVLRAATPVFAPDGRVFGIIIIDLDIRPAFQRIRSAIRPGADIYVVRENGDYLLSPDASEEFGSELGKPTRWQNDFPDLVPASGARGTAARVMRDDDGQSGGAGLAMVQLAGGPVVGVIEQVPRSVIMAAAVPVRDSSLLVGVVATLFAAGLGIYLARTLSRPLVQITAAVNKFPNMTPDDLPTQVGGEVGVLSRVFGRVLTELSDKAAAFAREVDSHRTTQAAREKYETQARLFSAAVESSNDVVITKSLDGTITGWNAAAERLLGYTADEAIGKHIDLVVPDDRRSELRNIFKRVIRGESVDAYETVRRTRDGELIDLSLTVSPIKGPDGSIIGATKIARDIRDIKRTEAALQQGAEALLESERMARGIINTALDAFVQIDESGRIIDWNSQAETIFGWSRHEAVGRPLRDLILPEKARTPDDPLTDAMRSVDVMISGARFEVDAQRKDGADIRIELSITCFRRRDGFVFNAFIRDLTEKIAADAQFRQAQKMEAVGQLTGGVAHDFNNILTVITGTIEILADAVADKPDLAGIAAMIDDAAGRGADLTKHLLAFARKQPLQPREVDVNTLISTTEKLLRPTLGEHIEIETVFAADPWLAFVDPSQLTTAVLNLALNARDAMPERGKLTIETKNVMLDENYAAQNNEVKAGPYVMLAISDTGIGIPADKIEKVFEPFFTTKEMGKGTGLGLSMVYGFVKQSGGHVKIYSEEGHGTTVRLYLPRSMLTTHAAAELPPSEKIEGGNELVLVVEDDEMVRNYVVTQVRSLGYRTLSAANAEAALAILRQNDAIDLLFTDVIMPGAMNGRQLVDEVVKFRPGLKVLYTSGYTENAIVHHGRLDAGVLLLAKPYRKSDLARMMRLAIDGANVPEMS